MNVFSAIVIYVLIWWMVFFCVLPFDIKNAVQLGDGLMPDAPVNPGLKKKLIITFVIATVLWICAYAIVTSNLISFHDMAAKMSM